MAYQRLLLLSKSQETFLKVVSSETNDLPVGNLQENWHPAFVGPKLEELRQYEASIHHEVELICQSVLSKHSVESQQLVGER